MAKNVLPLKEHIHCFKTKVNKCSNETWHRSNISIVPKLFSPALNKFVFYICSCPNDDADAAHVLEMALSGPLRGRRNPF